MLATRGGSSRVRYSQIFFKEVQPQFGVKATFLLMIKLFDGTEL